MSVGDALATLIPDDIGVAVRAFDGTRAGTPDADVAVTVTSARAWQAIAGAPGQLGLARAYVDGDLQIDGDVYEALSRLHAGVRRPGPADVLRIGRHLAPFALHRLPPPPEEVRLTGRRHGKGRDAAAIRHHYDVSNAFYRLVLGPSMAYTCAVYPTAGATLEQAQAQKFDLVCRKLGLRPGMRLLDVGCGWGGMALHAAEHYGVRVVAVTLSASQAAWGQRAVLERGVGDLVQIRHGDYRDIRQRGFDAVSSIGLTEHIGKANYPRYFRFLRARLVDGGRLLNHCITRTETHEHRSVRRGFINRYVFPDGELLHVGHLVDQMERTGLEVRHEENLREHYALTLRDWSANLDSNWTQAVAEVGLRKARVWRLYLAASRWGFERNVVQLHQVLAARTGGDGAARMPLRPQW